MFERYMVIGVAFSFVIVILDFYMLRKRRIDGKTFVLWFTIGLVIGVFSGVPYLFELLTLLFGTDVLVSAVTASAFLFLLLMIFYLNYRLSEIQSQLKKLAMELSVERYRQKQTQQNCPESKSKNGESREDGNE